MRTEEEIKVMFPEFQWYGRRFDKAAALVAAGGAKKHVFVPSNTTIYTVVGFAGDEVVDPVRPYCSCGDFFFNVMRKKEEFCHHLLAYKMAEKLGFDTVTFHDDEYDLFISALSRDIVVRSFGREV
ncbi:MAG: hypothetical protein JRN62_04280 [Nitrososphaerota archaeon]|nr:hypothetical protein [Nitrososphaerota archaeon]MDG6948821.1 hypothetical protein [Nitrososphaerota archaeon]